MTLSTFSGSSEGMRYLANTIGCDSNQLPLLLRPAWTHLAQRLGPIPRPHLDPLEPVLVHFQKPIRAHPPLHNGAQLLLNALDDPLCFLQARGDDVEPQTREGRRRSVRESRVEQG